MEEKILDKKKFSMEIERKVLEPGVGYMSAIIESCEELNLDFADIRGLLTPSLKSKIEAEAIENNYMKGGNTLPI